MSFSEPPKKKQKLTHFESITTISADSIEFEPKRKKSAQRSESENKKNELDLSTIKLTFELANIVGIDPLILEFDEDESMNEIETKLKSITGIGDKIQFQDEFTPNNKVPKSFAIKVGNRDIIDFDANKFQISSNTRFIQYWNDLKDEMNKYDSNDNNNNNHIQYEGDMIVELDNNELQIGDAIITFQRTLRIPDDDKTYPLPPGLQKFDIVKVEDYMTSDGLPQKWKKRKGIIIPMWQKEAMWMEFSADDQCWLVYLY